MHIRLGYDISVDCPQPTPMILMLNVHYTRVSDLMEPDVIRFTPPIASSGYRDGYGNWCTRILAPAGTTRFTTNALIHDHGQREPVLPHAQQVAVEHLPEEALVYLLGSRYCETERLLNVAWQLFGNAPQGWGRVQTICDYVHRHIQFGYHHARPSKTAFEAWQEGAGVCRDYAHLAITLCRCMNIPARYCTGYLGDIGVTPLPGPMDFAGWFEAYLDGQWYTFDARNNQPRIGRVLIARGRDAADVAICTSFGQHTLSNFRVWTDEQRGP